MMDIGSRHNEREDMDKTVFDVLNNANVNGHTEKVKADYGKELTYLSWAWAWAEVKKRYPDANYEIEKFNGLPYVFDELTGYMVYTKVTIEGICHEMWLPVMNSNNKAMKATPYTYKTKNGDKTVEAATMFDINKAIMRCLTKNLAMFGLGLYIYAGEDIPEVEKTAEEETQLKAMTEELKDLYVRAGGKNFEKWVTDCKGISAETYPTMKAKLLKQINESMAKEKKA